jgi:hypothetical protein
MSSPPEDVTVTTGVSRAVSVTVITADESGFAAILPNSRAVLFAIVRAVVISAFVAALAWLSVAMALGAKTAKETMEARTRSLFTFVSLWKSGTVVVG